METVKVPKEFMEYVWRFVEMKWHFEEMNANDGRVKRMTNYKHKPTSVRKSYDQMSIDDVSKIVGTRIKLVQDETGLSWLDAFRLAREKHVELFKAYERKWREVRRK